jgi:DNA-binding NarL/FixJ family response regulator
MEVARQIQRENLPVAVVFVTAFKDTRLFQEARNLGVRGYILKESAVTEILEGIKTVAGGGLFTSPALSQLVAHRKKLGFDLVRATPGLAGLSPTQRRILKLIASDRTSKEIADELGISHRTVENHRGNIAAKLDIRGSHSLLKFAYDNKDALEND